MATNTIQPTAPIAPTPSPPVLTNPTPLPGQPTPSPARVSVEVPATVPFPWNSFNPDWIKVLEEVGPIAYLALLCLLVWLLTRFVEAVKRE